VPLARVLGAPHIDAMFSDSVPAPERALVHFRFYEELNDFLAPALRRRDIEYRCARAATVKNAIEALGVPHTEVELILVNGRSVDFSYLMHEGDRVSVYPTFESFDIQPLLRVRETPLRELRFVADAHLGGLARLLRMLGFDTVYGNEITDEQIRDLACSDRRIVLTRDRELLKRREITHGCYIRALKPNQQLREIVQRLQLEAHVVAGLAGMDRPADGRHLSSLPGRGGAEGDAVVCADSHHPAGCAGTPPRVGGEDRRGGRVRPFTRCLHCNWPLTAVSKDEVLDRLPERVAVSYHTFTVCTCCGRVFWPGSHWQRMRAMLADHLSGSVPPATS
jgi:uncharacterized protein with PIN domain